jgi:hypothetical protein
MFTPWNEVCAVRFPTGGDFSSVSGKGVFQGYQAIPPGIYIFSKGFVKSSINLQGRWSFFSYCDGRTPENKNSIFCALQPKALAI